MKLKVQIEGRAFEVEVGDLDARPIVATVDGERIEVWPATAEARGGVPSPAPAGASGGAPAGPPGSAPTPSSVGAHGGAPTSPPASASGSASVPGGDKALLVRAPIPGVIIAIAARPGARVEVGDELCVLEAMKMRNAIRATRAGQIAQVHVTVGQHVKHQDPLVEFAP
jgi:glutaconyl-CoA/methylmalonyl-CoA decarboxylase subunit gamma